MKKRMNYRSSKGAAMIALVLSLFLFVSLAGFFAFDASRAEMAKRELVAACDAASLAGTSMMATYDTSPDNPTAVSLATAQQSAAAYAVNMFQKGSLLGHSMLDANFVTAAPIATPAPGQVNVLVALTDPTNAYQGVAAGSANGKAISVFAAYGYVPAFLPGFFGNIGSNYILNASSTGGLPQVDAVMVFDFSGSMDDFTKVTFIRRSWDGVAMVSGTHADRVRYIALVPPSSSTTLSDYIAWNYDSGSGGNAAGSEVNVLPPQNLGRAGGNPLPPGVPSPTAPQYPFTFDSALRAGGPGLGVPSDFGTTPGDCTLTVAQGGWISNTYPYQGGWLPSPTPPTTCWATSYAQASTLYGYPPATDGVWVPQRPYLLKYNPNYNATAVASHLKATWSGSPGPGPNGAWVTLDCKGADIGVGGLAGTGRYTDLVVNLATPGFPIVQPVACPDSFSGGAPSYTGFSYTFPSAPDEPDSRLAGQSFNFLNMATIVEASRGNLDNKTNFNAAIPSPWDPQKTGTVEDIAGNTVVLTTPGNQNGSNYYQLAYQRLAMLEAQPYATAVDGAVNGFFYKINGLADCRFGLVGFSTSQPPPPPPTAGSGTTINAAGPNMSTLGTYDIYSYYIAYGTTNAVWQSYTGTGYAVGSTSSDNLVSLNGSPGQQGFRVPRTDLNATYANLNECCSQPLGATPWNCPDGSPVGQIWSSMSTGANGLYNCRPLNDTYMGEALTTAVDMFTASSTGYTLTSRPAATKAIVLFTDGEPTGGITGADALAANAAAAKAKLNGIAIYTIGLNMNGNATLSTDQNNFLGDGLSSGNGLAKIAGNGGTYFQCGTSLQVRQSFTSVARRLTQNQS